MGGATSVMPVIMDVFSQQAADNTQWVDTIDWTVRCDWLQVAIFRILLLCTPNTCERFAGLLTSFIVVVKGGLNAVI